MTRNTTPAAKARKRRWLKKQDPNWKKEDHRYRRYGITRQDYEKLLEKQHNACKICAKPFNKKRPHIDHDHKTGKVRALLCFACNSGIGMLRESEFTLARAIAYLKWAGSIQTEIEPWASSVFVDLPEPSSRSSSAARSF